jgi:hypothetical protein
VVFADSDDEAAPDENGGDVFPAEAVDEPSPLGDQPAEDNGRATVAIPIAEMPLPSASAEQVDDAPFEPTGETDDEPVFEIDADAVIESGVEYDFGEADEAPPDAGGGEDAAQALDPAQVFEAAAAADPVIESEVEDVAEVESATVPLTVAEIEAGAEPEPVFDLIGDDETAIEDRDEPEIEAPADRVDPSILGDGDEGAGEPRAEELPLPTMTLARLALDQADLELAEKTLRGVLERNPDHAEAAELLAGLTASAGEGVPAEDASSDATIDSRARALRRWLEAVRLASERLKT